MRISAKSAAIVAATACVISGVGIYAWRDEFRPHILEVYVFDMKAGRALFIRTPDDRRILVDGGGASEIIRHITSVLPFYSRRIDGIVLTSFEGKHIAGAIDVLTRYQVSTVFVPGLSPQSLGLATSSDQSYQAFTDAVAALGLVARPLVAGDTIILDNSVDLTAVFPALQGPEGFTYSKASPPELLFTVSYGSTSIAYMGGASKKAQSHIASSDILMPFAFPDAKKSNALIFSRSVSTSTLSSKLLERLSPRIMIYSAAMKKTGKSNGAAAVDTMQQADQINIKEKGSIRIVSDGVFLEASSL